jgi:Alcohol dehydrogenase transcription factor Myb/SANT-like
MEDLFLIKAVQSRPILWDSRIEEFKNQEMKNAVWLEIGGDNLTAGKKILVINF